MLLNQNIVECITKATCSMFLSLKTKQKQQQSSLTILLEGAPLFLS